MDLTEISSTKDGAAAAPPEALTLAPEQVRTILAEQFGIDAFQLREMQSELASVFRIETPDGQRYACKASRYSETELRIAEWRTSAMDRLQDLGVPAGRTVLSLAREPLTVAETDRGAAIIHVGDWLDGTPLDSLQPSAALLREVGHTAAAVSRGLETWPKPPAQIAHPWELTRTLQTLASTMPAATDPAVRTLLEQASTRFAAHVAPRLRTLPRQVVHHDLHDSNLLIRDDAVTGVLDFGDMVWGPRVAELIVAGAYASRRCDDPVSALLDVAEGWGRQVPLREDEIDIIVDSVVARLAVNLSVWTARRESDRGAYAEARSAGVEHVVAMYLEADRAAVIAALQERLGAH